jgi:hypothetical protein
MNAMQQRHARRVCGRAAARRDDVLDLYRAARPLMDHQVVSIPERGTLVFLWTPYWGRVDGGALVALVELAQAIGAALHWQRGEHGPILTLTRSTGLR